MSKYTVHHLTCDFPKCSADVERPKPGGKVGYPDGWLARNGKDYCPRHVEKARP